MEFVSWGTISSNREGSSNLALTIDLQDLQKNLTSVLRTQLNQSDHCGTRLSIERATLAPASPLSLLSANVHFERYACAKAFGKQIVKRLAAGSGMIDVKLTPSIDKNRVALTAQVTNIQADGSVGELLRSGSPGESIRKKAAASIESAIQKALNSKSTMPDAIENAVVFETIQFDDGGSGKLLLRLTAEVKLTPAQFQDLVKNSPH